MASPPGGAPARPVVVFLDPHGAEIRAAIEAECPATVTLRMATPADPADRRPLVADAAFFVGGITPIPASLIEAAPGLRLIQKWGIGVDKIDLAAARARGIPVAITAGANAVPVAEFTLLLVLAVLRRLPHREAQLRAGEWRDARDEQRVQARQLRGRTVALIGLGAIGREVAKRLRAFDAEVRYFDVRRLAAADEARARGAVPGPRRAPPGSRRRQPPRAAHARDARPPLPGADRAAQAAGDRDQHGPGGAGGRGGARRGAGRRPAGRRRHRRVRRRAAAGRPSVARAQPCRVSSSRPTWRARSSTTSPAWPVTRSRTSSACSTVSPSRRGTSSREADDRHSRMTRRPDAVRGEAWYSSAVSVTGTSFSA